MLKKNDLIVNRIVKEIALTTRKFQKNGKVYSCYYIVPESFVFSPEIIKQFERMFGCNNFEYTIRAKYENKSLIVRALISLPRAFRTESLKRLALISNGKTYTGTFVCTRSPKKALDNLLKDSSFTFTFSNRSISMSAK